MPLGDKLKTLPAQPTRPTSPLWAGPAGDGPNGGVTYSLLCRYLSCKERFRLYTMLGLKPVDRFESKLEFGNMWHVCEEALAGHTLGLCPTCGGEWTAGKAKKLDERPPPANCPNCEGKPNQPFCDWQLNLKDYCEQLCRKYRSDQEQVSHWYEITKALFPLYVQHWEKNRTSSNRKPLLQEQVFDQEYKLPSGRSVRLRSKLDSVDYEAIGTKKCNQCYGKGKILIVGFQGKDKESICQKCKGSKEISELGIWLQENKSKSQIDQYKITRQLTYDLQTMTYLILLGEDKKDEKGHLAGKYKKGEFNRTLPIAGVRYNVVRRSAHKSVGSMLEKVGLDCRNGRAGEWFSRWELRVTEADIARFKEECLNPVLENLLDDYQWWAWCFDHGGKEKRGNHLDYRNRQYEYPMHISRMFRFPYGVYNPIAEGGFGDVDGYMNDGSEVGLRRVTNLFPELQEG